MKTWKTLKKELLADKATAKEYQNLEAQYALISQVIEKRRQLRLTQSQLAEKVGTKQSAIARFEAGNVNPSLGFLEKVAKALNSEVKIIFQ